MKTILIIDDEESIRQSFSDYLEDKDFITLTAENGLNGLDIVKMEKVDLILTDLRMPEMNGLEFMQHCKNLNPGIPIIVISGVNQINGVIEALQLGAWDYLVKPIKELSMLNYAIEKALERANLIQENINYRENLEQLVQQRTNDLEIANLKLININTRLKDIAKATRGISMCKKVASLGATLLGEFAKNMLARGGSIYLTEKNGLRLLHALDPGHQTDFIPFPLKDGSIFAQVLNDKIPILIKDITQKYNTVTSGWNGYKDTSILAFPLPDKENTIMGVLTLHSKITPPFIEEDLEIGLILASHSCETIQAVRAAETLQESETRFKDLADMLPEAIFETDLNFNLTYANKYAFELFRYTPDDLVNGLFSLDMISDEDKIKTELNILKLLEGESIENIEFIATRKDNTIFPILVNMNMVIKDSKPAGFRGIVIDITEQKLAEKNLMSEKLRAEKSDHLKSAFLANMSHEIRTPLNGILGHIDLVLQDNLDIKNQNENLDSLKIARNSGNLLISIIEDILDLSKIEIGEMKIDKKAFSLKSVIEQVKRICQILIDQKSKKTTFKYDIDPNITVLIYGDNLRIQQVLNNLISNAIKFTEKGSISLTVKLIDNYLNFALSDTGEGIPENQLELIFESFRQADISHTRKYGGTGLGLTISKELVELMGGNLKVISKTGLNHGSTFFFSIPYEPAQEEIVDTFITEKPYTDTRGSGKILIVEDDSINRLIIQKLLNKTGYEVEIAINGKEGVDKYKTDTSIDLIIMDIQMPVMDGLQATREIRYIENSNNGERIPVIALSAAAMTVDRDRGMEAGIDKYLTKPVNHEELLIVLASYLK